MKKICVIIFSVALFASFAACSGTKKEENKVKEAVEIVEPDAAQAEPEAVVPEVKPDEAVKAFHAFAKEYVEAFNNITKNPAKFSALAGQLEEKVATMERIKSTFSKRQLSDYQTARELINKVNTAGKK